MHKERIPLYLTSLAERQSMRSMLAAVVLLLLFLAAAQLILLAWFGAAPVRYYLPEPGQGWIAPDFW